LEERAQPDRSAKLAVTGSRWAITLGIRVERLVVPDSNLSSS
jgi:hypothetical protein